LQPFGVSKIKEDSVDRIIYLFEFHNKNGCCEIPSKAPLTLPERGETVAEKLLRVTFLPSGRLGGAWLMLNFFDKNMGKKFTNSEHPT